MSLNNLNQNKSIVKSIIICVKIANFAIITLQKLCTIHVIINGKVGSHFEPLYDIAIYKQLQQNQSTPSMLRI